MKNIIDKKLSEIRLYIAREAQQWRQFDGAVVVGSVSVGECRPDSDIDAYFFFKELDMRIMPAEFMWLPETGTYYTIFDDDAQKAGAIHIDAKRVTFAAMQKAEWEDGTKHELANGIVVCDKEGQIQQLLAGKLAYPNDLRQHRVMEHLGRASYQLTEWRLMEWLNRGDMFIAQDQLSIGLEEIIKALHAYNRVWLPWRYRWFISALKLPLQPMDFAQKLEEIQFNCGLNTNSLRTRRNILESIVTDVQIQCEAEGLLVDEGAIFQSTHSELGYAHNMEQWKAAHSEWLRSEGY